MNTANLLAPSALRAYGTPLACYSGQGRLTLRSMTGVDCQFVAGQMENGETLLLCATSEHPPELFGGWVTPTGFEGSTTEGLRVSTSGAMYETGYLPALSDHAGTWLALHVTHLEVVRPRLRHRRRLSYLLTNVAGLLAPISFPVAGFTLDLTPLEEASAANRQRLAVLKGVLPTARIDVATTAPTEGVTKAVDEVCYLLSVALGSKVQWISMAEGTVGGRSIRTHHYSRITKRYGSLHVIDPRSNEIADYLRMVSGDGAKPARERVGVSEAVLDAYLDAKAESDFLQLRALKLVVSVEMLKAEYLSASGVSHLVIGQDLFQTLVPDLKKVMKLKLPNVTAIDRAALYANLAGLNRAPFNKQIQGLCTAVGMPLFEGELERFVSSRNKLVHEGRFYCERATEREKTKLPPLASQSAEYFWLLHFVDRLFLRGLGYEGPYIDWSAPGAPRRSVLARSA